MMPAVLDYTINGRVMQRNGNDDPLMAPHGIYRAQGDDNWVAVAVATDGQWRSLCAVLGRDDLAGLPAAERLAQRRQLDEVVSAWTAQRTMGEAMACLQQAGVPSHQAQNSGEAFDDPQLKHRQHFQLVPHSAMGETWVEGSRLHLSRTPAVVGQPPMLGEHSWEVLTGILGYDDDHAGQLAAAGIVE
jgi:benzylsuccinate CoA-transferase BbsF subunit